MRYHPGRCTRCTTFELAVKLMLPHELAEGCNLFSRDAFSTNRAERIDNEFCRIVIASERAGTSGSQTDMVPRDAEFAREEIGAVDGTRRHLGGEAKFVGCVQRRPLDRAAGFSGVGGDDCFRSGTEEANSGVRPGYVIVALGQATDGPRGDEALKGATDPGVSPQAFLDEFRGREDRARLKSANITANGFSRGDSHGLFYYRKMNQNKHKNLIPKLNLLLTGQEIATIDR